MVMTDYIERDGQCKWLEGINHVLSANDMSHENERLVAST